MMGQLNRDQEQFFYSFRLDEVVPEDHPVRRLPQCSIWAGSIPIGDLLS